VVASEGGWVCACVCVGIRVSFDRPISWQETDGVASVHLARALDLWS
jgi:hypothetical protein